jgi:acetyl esterase/lipase
VPDTVSPEAQRYLAARKAKGPAIGPREAADWADAQQAFERAGRRAGEWLRERYTFTTREVAPGGVRCLLIEPKAVAPARAGQLIVYLHGGAYTWFSPESTLPASVPLADAAGVPVLAVDYRLAWQHPFPGALDDALAVYRALLVDRPARDLVVFGDSAGGGLALALVLRARELALPLPAAVGVYAPWTDLAPRGDSLTTLAGADPLLRDDRDLEQGAAVYAAGRSLSDPLLSPVYADFAAGFPPTLIQVGTRDRLLSDSARLQRAMARGGVDVRLTLWEGMWHVFQLTPPDLPEGREAAREMAAFLAGHLGRGP